MMTAYFAPFSCNSVPKRWWAAALAAALFFTVSSDSPAQDYNAILNTNEPLTFVTDPPTRWISDASTGVTGASLRNTTLGDAEDIFLRTTVTGPKIVGFWWKSSTLSSADKFIFRLNGIDYAQISGISSGGPSSINGFDPVVITLSPGTHTLEWFFDRSFGTAGQDAVWLDSLGTVAVTPYSNADVLDLPSQIFTVSDQRDWIIDTEDFILGNSSLKSFFLPDAQDSFIESIIPGPAALTFNWQTSTNVATDRFVLVINGAEVASLAGADQPWQALDIDLPPGSNTVRWLFDREPGIGGNDFVKLDGIRTFPRAAVDVNQLLDESSFPFTISNLRHWDREKSSAIEGQSLRSSWLADDEDASINATMTGPATLGWWWSSSTLAGVDRLVLKVNGAEVAAISGINSGFQFTQIDLPPGENDVQFLFDRNIGRGGEDFVLIDSIQYNGRPAFNISDVVDDLDSVFSVSDVRHWDRDIAISSIGGSSLRSSFLEDAETAALISEVVGPALLTFQWRTAAFDGNDEFRVFVGGSPIDGLTTTQTNFSTVTTFIPPGVQLVEWKIRGVGGAQGPPVGWIDNVSITLFNANGAAITPTLGATLNPAILNVSGNTTQWRYTWSSNSGLDPVITRAIGTATEDLLRNGEGGASFQVGETWTVFIDGYNGSGSPTGDAISGQFFIKGPTVVEFSGWTIR